VTIAIPKPIDLGLPPRFTGWRPFQEDVVRSILCADGRRFIGHALPTGAGKSLAYIAAALISGRRTVILTKTKGLQDQIESEFGKDLVADIRGRNAYACLLVPGVSCADGPCSHGVKCPHKQLDCPYRTALKRAMEAGIVVTNYSFWFHAQAFADGLGKVDFLVLDEGHEAGEALTDFLVIEITKKEISELLGEQLRYYGADLDRWQEWAQTSASIASHRRAQYVRKAEGGLTKAQLHRASRLKVLEQSLLAITQSLDYYWIVHRTEDGVRFGPSRLDPGLVERLLFAGAEKVYLTSATLCERTLEFLGLSEESYNFSEWPSSFPIANRRILHIPTLRINYGTTSRDLALMWVGRIDQIISGRLDRKGIVHTQSFKKRDIVLQNSEHKEILFTNTDTYKIAEIVDVFKRTHAPAVLVTPSAKAGFDFPYEECRYQIIGKIPFPSTADEILRARLQRDPRLLDYLTMQALVQTCGRGIRAADDFCETYIIDDTVEWWFPKIADMAPRWFREAFGKVNVIPKPSSLEGRKRKAS